MRERLDSFAGSQDIVEGNTKLILGLMWSIVQRYQIALKTKIPPKKLVMAWMQVGETVLTHSSGLLPARRPRRIVILLQFTQYSTGQLGPGSSFKEEGHPFIK